MNDPDIRTIEWNCMSYTIEQRDKELLNTSPGIRYYLSFPQAGSHLMHVEIKVDTEQDQLVFSMPNWLPGSYKIRDFISWQGNVEVLDADGNQLPYEWLTTNRLQVEAGESTSVALRYLYFANERSVRQSHVNRFHAFINPGNCLMFVEGRTDEIHHVAIEHPWNHVATALSPVTDGVWGALNYDILVDSPIEIGDHYVSRYERHGAEHEIVITGSGDFDPDWITERTKIIIDKAVEMWGGLPYDRYVFILQFLPGQYGGLEHARSQVSMFDSNFFNDKKKIGKFLSLLTHEFFHTWNVKRIRARELGPFNYNDQNYTRMLWLAEGATSYYDDLMSYRCGFFTRDEYLKTLSESHLSTLLDVPGREVMSIKDSSFLAWVKLYNPSPDSANRFPSYYLKGGVLFWLLDLFIIDQSGAATSLDEGMRALYGRYEENPAEGITEEEFISIVSAATGVDIGQTFLSWLNSIDELPFEKLLAPLGLEWKKKEKKEESIGENVSIPHADKAWFGLGVREEKGALVVAKVLAGSPAEDAGIGSGDEIIAVNGKRTSSFDIWKGILRSLDNEEELTLLCSSEGDLYETRVKPIERPPYHLAVVDKLTPDQKARLEKWLARNGMKGSPEKKESVVEEVEQG